MQSTKTKMLSRLAGLALAGVATFASAQSSEGTQGGVSLHYGIGDHYKRLTLN
jgi:lipid A 3-O-deacylase